MFMPGSPLLVAVFVAVTGLAIMPWVLRQPTRTRIGIVLVYLGLYTFALVRAGILPVQPAPPAFQAGARILVQGLQLLWWFVFARCLIGIGRVFLLYKHKLHERKFATDLLAGLVYLAVSFAVVGLVFELSLTGLLATSGVVAIVLGLALQSTVGDLFSGIALTLERPYRIGDSIGLEGDVEGTVIEISWRATHIMTWAQDDIVVPNSVIAKSRIINYSFPVRVHGVTFRVSLDDRTPPARAIEILDQALLQCRSVLRVPRPQVSTSHFGPTSIGYSVSFFVERFEAAAQAKSEVLALIHRHAEWAGVALGRRRQDVRSDPQPNGPPHDGAQVKNILDRIPIFAGLSATERETLSAALSRRDFSDGEVVFEQGQPSDSLFLIEAGVVGLSRVNESGATEEIGRRGPGDFIGANALMSGVPRIGTVRALARCTLYEVRKESVALLLKGHPHLRVHMSSMLPQDVLLDRGVSKSPADADGTKAKSWLFEQVARLFNLETGV